MGIAISIFFVDLFMPALGGTFHKVVVRNKDINPHTNFYSTRISMSLIFKLSKQISITQSQQINIYKFPINNHNFFLQPCQFKRNKVIYQSMQTEQMNIAIIFVVTSKSGLIFLSSQNQYVIIVKFSKQITIDIAFSKQILINPATTDQYLQISSGSLRIYMIHQVV